MARETFVKECLNLEVNDYINLYETFGWELMQNSVLNSMGNELVTLGRNSLTFSRDKDAVWYPEVVNLEHEYDLCEEQIKKINFSEPKEPSAFNILIFLLLFLFTCGIGSAIYTLIHFIESSHKKTMIKEWHEKNDSVIVDLKNQMNSIITKSRALINNRV